MKTMKIAISFALVATLGVLPVHAEWKKTDNEVTSKSVPVNGSNNTFDWVWTYDTAARKLKVAITTSDSHESNTYTGGSGSVSLRDTLTWSGGGTPTGGTFQVQYAANTASTAVAKKHYDYDGSMASIDVMASCSISTGWFENISSKEWGARSSKKADLLTSTAQPDPTKRTGISAALQFKIQKGSPATWLGGSGFNLNWSVEVLNAAVAGVESSDKTECNSTETKTYPCAPPGSLLTATGQLTVNPQATGHDVDNLFWGHETTVSGDGTQTVDLLHAP